MSAEATGQTEPASSGGRRLSRFIKPAVIIGVIVVIECVAAAMLLPTAEDTEDLGKNLAAARVHGTDAAAEDGQEAVDRLDLREVKMGAYHVAVFQPASNSTLRIDVELYGIVLADDHAVFEALFPQHEHRLSEQVHGTFRAAEITDLTDAGLGLIKRQILEKSNRTLGKPLLKDVVFSKFSFIEQ
jgi:flagellar FliL protein